MYDFLSSHGSCYYIEYLGVLVGDVSLRDDGEIAIVVCEEYQNRHIGRRCVTEMEQWDFEHWGIQYWTAHTPERTEET